ncbi:hypothetical protein QCA50_013677 [Cerrena zonata]|uniref:F-box domain-containing protein n=1 Tax=Cerrena zonata TaxID=2478898 RepID=A0AAW0FVD5_9APHY
MYHTSFPDLPIEMHYKVMEHLDNDTKTLHACSMTNKTWLSIARTFTFREIALSTYNVSARFHRLMRRNPDLGFYIRAIRLRPCEVYDGRKEETLRLHAYLPADVAMTLRSVQKLSIEGIHVWSTDDFDILTMLPSVVELSMANCSFMPRELYPIINSLPGLRILRIRLCMHWTSSVPEENADMQAITPVIEKLHFSCLAPPFDAATKFIRCLAFSDHSKALDDVRICIGSRIFSTSNNTSSSLREFVEETRSSQSVSNPSLHLTSPNKPIVDNIAILAEFLRNTRR